ncbi:MAG: leucine-rich repeat protein [Clostridia bacterium]|nr:leucine-rich repeat protein [Clostridia bacterium]
MNRYLKVLLFAIIVLSLSVCLVACDGVTLPPDDGGEGTPATFTVRYDANGGSGFMSNSVCTEGDSLLVKNCTFSKAGMVFQSWNTKADGSGEAYQPADQLTPTANMTLYAIWGSGSADPDIWTVHYDANGGSGTMKDSTCDKGDSITVKRCTFTADSDFVEWNTKADGSGESYQPADELTPGGNMTLYAIWESPVVDPDIWTVRYDANGGSGTMKDSTCDKGDSITVRRCTFTADSDFVEWNTKADGSGESYQPADELTPDGNMTLYAIWESPVVEPDIWTIRYNANGGTGSMQENEYEDGTQIHIAANGFSYTGKVFVSWNTAADGSGVTYNPGQLLVVTENLDLYAIWADEAVTLYTVTYHANGGSGSMPSTSYPQGTLINVLENAFTHTLNFLEWNTAADGTGTSYAPAQQVALEADLDLYAIWEVEYCTVTFDYCGFGANTSVSVPKNTLVEEPTAPIAGGYTFEGWYTQKEGGVRWIFNTNAVSETMTLYAHMLQVGVGIVSVNNGYVTGNSIYITVPEGTAAYSLNGQLETTKNSAWKLYAATLTGVAEVPTRMLTGIGIGENFGDGSYTLTVWDVNDENVRESYIITVFRQFTATINYYGYNYTPSTGEIDPLTGYKKYDDTFELGCLEPTETPIKTEKIKVEQAGTTLSIDHVPAMSIPGHTLTGYDFEFGVEELEDEVIDIYPLFETDVYTVTLYTGTETKQIEILYDYCIFYEPNPSVEEGTFVGYYTEAGVKFLSASMIYCDCLYLMPLGGIDALYAKYIMNQYPLNVYGENGTVTVEGAGDYTFGKEVDFASRVTLEATPDTGYRFVGWTMEGVSGYLSTDPTYDYRIGKVNEITAEFEALRFTITLDASTYPVEQTEYEIAYGESITLPIPEGEGYFMGWTLEDGTKITGEQGELLAPYAYLENITVYPNFVMLSIENGELTAVLEVPANGILELPTSVTSIAANAIPAGVKYLVITSEGGLQLYRGSFDRATDLIAVSFPDSESTAEIDFGNLSSDALFLFGFDSSHSDRISRDFCDNKLFNCTLDDYVVVNGGTYYKHDDGAALVDYNGTAEVFYMEDSVTIHGVECPVTFIAQPAVLDKSFHAIMVSDNVTDINNFGGSPLHIARSGQEGASWQKIDGVKYARLPYKSMEEGVEYVFMGDYYLRIDTVAKEAVIYAIFHEEDEEVFNLNFPAFVRGSDGTEYPITRVEERSHNTVFGTVGKYNLHISETLTLIDAGFLYNLSIGTINVTNLTNWCTIFEISGNSMYNLAYQAEAILFKGEPIVDLVIPEGVESIQEYAFYQCTSIKSVFIPDSIKTVGQKAFLGCTGIESLNVPFVGETATANQNVSWMFGEAAKSSLKEVTVRGKVAIGDNAFDSHLALEKVTLSAATSIGYRAFYGCISLRGIDIPDSCTSIANDAFYNCSLLADVAFSNTLLSIGNNAFYDCTSLKKLVFPDSLESIGTNAFWSNENLYSVTLGKNLTSIGNRAFYLCTKLAEVINLSSLPITAGSDDYGYVAYYAELVVTDEEDRAYREEGNFLVGETDTEKVLKSYIGSDEYVVIPDGFTSIAPSAFAATKVRRVEIPDSVTSIGEKAFYSCAYLTEVVLSETSGLRSIGNRAFEGTQISSLLLGPDFEEMATSALDYSRVVEIYNLSSFVLTPDSNGKYYGADTVLNVYTPNDGESIISVEEGAVVYAYDGEVYLHSYLGTPHEIAIPEGVTLFSCESVLDSLARALVSVHFPSTFKEIPAFAFCGPTKLDYAKLTHVTFAENSVLTSIGEQAFIFCAQLAEITIPNSVTYIGSSAFAGCTSLEKISMPFVGETATTNNTFTWMGITASVPLKEVVILSGTSIGERLFNRFTLLERVTLPSNLETIGGYAFHGCNQLIEITIPDSCTSIGDYAFAYCTALERVTLPSSLKSIGNYAFNGCTALSEITIPNSCTSIGNYAFSGGTALSEITLSSSLETIGEYALAGAAFQTISLPSSLKTIGTGAFKQCAALTQIQIPGSCTSIGESAFVYCSSLTSVIFSSSSGVKTIPTRAFEYCSALTQISMPDSCTSIGESAFSDCSSLTSITIPDSVTSIGKYAFYDCRALSSITLGRKLSSIGNSAFAFCTNLHTIYNRSSLPLTKGSSDYGHVAYYATNIVNR